MLIDNHTDQIEYKIIKQNHDIPEYHFITHMTYSLDIS